MYNTETADAMQVTGSFATYYPLVTDTGNRETAEPRLSSIEKKRNHS